MSHTVNGRTYRDVVTTNDLKEPEKVEPKKLNLVTTKIIPNAVPQPAPKPVDLSKMITTHDELPRNTEALLCEIEDRPYAEALAKKIDADFKADAEESGPPEPKKKAGRPKKG